MSLFSRSPYDNDYDDDDYYHRRRRRRTSRYDEPDSSSGCLFPLILIIAIGVYIYDKNNFGLTPIFFLGGLIGSLLIILIVRYLTTESWGLRDYYPFKKPENKSLKPSDNTNKDETDLKKDLEAYVLNLLNSKSIEDNVTNKIQENLENSIISKLLDKFKIAGDKLHVLDFINDELFHLSSNTEKYIVRLNKNSIVNLMIGISGTGTAIFILGASAYNNTYSDLTSFTINFLPKIGFAVFIQIFSYFFLRLYKVNLEDSKYFQNELTNINSKISAIKMAYILEEKEKLISLIIDLSQTERNFKLQKDESTLNLEKARIEKDIDINFIDSMKTFMSNYKSK